MLTYKHHALVSMSCALAGAITESGLHNVHNSNQIWTDTVKIKTLLDIKSKIEKGNQSGPLLKLDEPELIFISDEDKLRSKAQKSVFHFSSFLVFYLPQIFMKRILQLRTAES